MLLYSGVFLRQRRKALSCQPSDMKTSSIGRWPGQKQGLLRFSPSLPDHRHLVRRAEQRSELQGAMCLSLVLTNYLTYINFLDLSFWGLGCCEDSKNYLTFP